MRKEGEFIRFKPKMLPCCGYIVTASGLPGEEIVFPKKDDLMVCLNCAAVLIYTDDAGSTRMMNDKEVAELEADALEQVERLKFEILKRGPLPRMRKSKIELN